MKAIVLHGPYDVRVETVPDATLRDARGAIVRVTKASICGSDLHLVHGTVPAIPGTVIGHECVGIVEDVGAEVRRFRKGDRVIVPGVVGWGDCEPCRRGCGCSLVEHFADSLAFRGTVDKCEERASRASARAVWESLDEE